MLKKSKNRQTQELPLTPIQLLFNNYPLAIWGGLWILLLLVATTAARGLMNPSFVKQEQPKYISPEPIEQKQPQPQVASRIVEKPSSPLPAFTKMPEAPKPKPEGVPLWLYGAIALGFATSSVLIYKSLPHQPQSRKPRKQVRVKLEASPTATIVKKGQRPPQKQRRRVPLNTGLTHLVESQPATVKKPLVTVLSPEESHPLDLGDNNLADMLDMRKRYSLTALLNKE